MSWLCKPKWGNVVVVIVAILLITATNLCLHLTESIQQMPNVTGAKLIGIFTDDIHLPERDRGQSVLSELAHHTATTTTTTTTTTKGFSSAENVKMNRLYYCHEVIFENDTAHLVSSSKPICILGGQDQPIQQHHRRQKRQSVQGFSMPITFSIPTAKIGDNQPETVKVNSYIAMQLKVCTQPQGEVLVHDPVTRRILSGFRNLGTAYQCNQWMVDSFDSEPFQKQFISDSNQVQVEIGFPIDKFSFENVQYTYLNDEEPSSVGRRKLVASVQDGSTTTTTVDKPVTVIELDFQYWEIPFCYEPYHDQCVYNQSNTTVEEFSPELLSSSKKSVTLQYKANMVKTFIFPRRSNCDGSPGCRDDYFIGIKVTIRLLDLDFGKGDYLLIGPGTKPDFWKNSKSQIIAQKIDGGKSEWINIWINADSGFLRVVTHNSLSHSSSHSPALTFTWEEAATPLDNKDLNQVSKWLKAASIQLCFADMVCEIWESTVKLYFIDEVVHIVNNYLIDHENDITTLIDKNSVHTFDKLNITFPQSGSSGRMQHFCQLNLAISSPYDSEYPLVQGDVLRKMFFNGEHSRMVLRSSILVTDCVLHRISLNVILIPIAVILCLSLLITFIFWKMQNNIIKTNQVFNIKNKESLERLQPAPLNSDDAMHY